MDENGIPKYKFINHIHHDKFINILFAIFLITTNLLLLTLFSITIICFSKFYYNIEIIDLLKDNPIIYLIKDSFPNFLKNFIVPLLDSIFTSITGYNST